MKSKRKRYCPVCKVHLRRSQARCRYCGQHVFGLPHLAAIFLLMIFSLFVFKGL
ncbi:MAG: hypothetical protein H7Y30_16500 [Pyrinomonadaceae bacterium]|nr:hypothetical protein [Pyrinomonadaceae bacterium]